MNLKCLRYLGVLAGAAFCIAANVTVAATNSESGKLQVYFIDVEGGQSTLFITPTRQSLLIDTGWPGNNYRDADRIAAVAKQAGLSRIDYVLITHYHDDHVGGVPQLVERIPVGTFIDHGPNRELEDDVTKRDYAAFQQVLATGRYKVITPKPGDTLPVGGIAATVISADGNLIAQPLKGGGGREPNTYCKSSEIRPADQTENARSLGIEIDFGKLRILDLGDLTWDKEMELMCPVNKLGRIDVLIVSHHGWSQSSSPALVEGIHPRIAIMDNGAKKGGSLGTFQTLAKTQGLETLWQLHFSEEAGTAHNSADEYIANPRGPDAGHYLKLNADKDGSFDMFNARTGVNIHYAPVSH